MLRRYATGVLFVLVLVGCGNARSEGVLPMASKPEEAGRAGNAGTPFWIDPKRELIAICMVQVSNGVRVMLRNRFRTMVRSAIID